MQEDNWELSVCPSFSSYSSDKLAEIADKVADGEDGRHRGEELDDEFEFVSVSRADDDLVVVDGQIGPVFPVFNRDLLSTSRLQPACSDDREGRSLRVPLKKLFVEERDPTTSFSSSSSDGEEGEGDLEGVPPGTYCVWTPNNNNSAKPSPSRCKKSNSTGTKTSTGSSSSASKRWRLSSFLRRSNSEGKDSFVFLTPKKEEISRPEKAVNNRDQLRSKETKVKTVSSAHEAFYARNRAMKEGDKRRTYLPYRQDLVGFWANVGALGKTFPPF